VLERQDRKHLLHFLAGHFLCWQHDCEYQVDILPNSSLALSTHASIIAGNRVRNSSCTFAATNAQNKVTHAQLTTKSVLPAIMQVGGQGLQDAAPGTFNGFCVECQTDCDCGVNQYCGIDKSSVSLG
jgi:hypothetical protein